MSVTLYVSYFPYHKPSSSELDEKSWIEMTGHSWDPCDPAFSGPLGISISKVSRHASGPDVQRLARLFFTTPDLADRTTMATTRLAVTAAETPQYSHYGPKYRMFSKKQLQGSFYSDNFFSKLPSISGHKCAQIFANHHRFLYVVPMHAKSEAPHALKNFIDDIGRPETIVTDNAKEETSKAWSTHCKHYSIKMREVDPYCPYQNFAETAVRIVKLKCARIMEQASVPPVLWDYLLSYVCHVDNRTVHESTRPQDRTPFEYIHGYTPDISAISVHRFYDPVWYVVPKFSFPEPRRLCGRWLGPANVLMSDLSMKVLTVTGQVIVTSAISPMDPDDLALPQTLDDLRTIDLKMRSKADDKVDVAELWELDTLGTPVNLVDALAESDESAQHPSRGRSRSPTPSPRTIPRGKRLKRINSVDRICQDAADAIEEPSCTYVDIGGRDDAAAAIELADTGAAPGINGGRWESAEVRLPRGRALVVKRLSVSVNDEGYAYAPTNPLIDIDTYLVRYRDG